ncbi:MAG TPA: AMP-binding protein, partial [Minicystis sp.]|nr:AMP-binding protein [Minicystis sp.]
YMASKGQVQFPGSPEVHLDIIPVDMVTSGMIAALAELPEGTAPAVYQLGSSDTNACTMARYLELAGLYKRRQVFEGKRTSLFDVVSSRFEARGMTKKDWEATGAKRIAGTLKGLGGVFDKAAVGPLASLFKPAAKALKNAARSEERVAGVQEIFLPFVAEGEWVFSCEHTRAAFARMPAEERARFCWEPEKIDWRAWMWEVHLPGLEKWVYPLIDEKQQKQLKPLRAYEHLLDVLDEAAERWEHAVALQRLEADGLSRTTFLEWQKASRVVAARLAEAGVAPGDRVLLAGANQPAWPLAYFGVLRAGAVAVPVDPALEAQQMANVARAACAKVALWDVDVEERAGAAVRAATVGLKAYELEAFTDADGVEADDAALAIAHRPKGSDLASIIYTSGTTGEPKGVMLSHANFTALVAALAPVFELSQRDRVLSVLPLHHTFEFTCGLLLPLSRGARIVYLDELSGDRLAEGLVKARITGMVGVPALWQMLERRIVARVKERGPAAAMAFDWALELNRMIGKRAGLNLGKLLFGPIHEALGGGAKFLISGGAALPKDTAKLFAGLGLPLSEGYGLTEAAPVLTVSKASPRAVPGQVGKAIPGVEIKIHAPDEHGVGEVLARGPNVMVGYANDADATARTIDEAGWLHTGDLGKLDKKGRLVIVGRQKDVIVSASGENVYPDDAEAMLGRVPGVKELALVGLDDPRGGERVGCLAVVAGDEATARAERHERALRELREAFQKLPKAAQPAVVHLVDADLPRTATRKVKRPDVRA